MMSKYVDWRDPGNYLPTEVTPEYNPDLVIPWVTEVNVNWVAYADNLPTITLRHKDSFNPNEWDNKVWEFVENKSRSYYQSLSEDGRGEFHYHKKAYQDADGIWMTPQEEGYGGRHFNIKMIDGRDVILRGPWYGGAPKPFADVTTQADCDTLGFFGLCVEQDRLVQTVLHHLPNMRLFEVHDVTHSRKTTVEWMREDYLIPKVCWSKEHKRKIQDEIMIRRKRDEERRRAKRKEQA